MHGKVSLVLLFTYFSETLRRVERGPRKVVSSIVRTYKALKSQPPHNLTIPALPLDMHYRLGRGLGAPVLCWYRLV